MKITDLFKGAEVVTFHAERERPITDGEPHSPIVVTINGVKIRFNPGDFSRALCGERVKGTVL